MNRTLGRSLGRKGFFSGFTDLALAFLILLTVIVTGFILIDYGGDVEERTLSGDVDWEAPWLATALPNMQVPAPEGSASLLELVRGAPDEDALTQYLMDALSRLRPAPDTEDRMSGFSVFVIKDRTLLACVDQFPATDRAFCLRAAGGGLGIPSDRERRDLEESLESRSTESAVMALQAGLDDGTLALQPYPTEDGLIVFGVVQR